MDGTMLGALITLGTEAVIGVVWAVRQEGRIDKVQSDLVTLAESVAADLAASKELTGSKLDDIKDRLVRIERHVLNGSYKDHTNA